MDIPSLLGENPAVAVWISYLAGVATSFTPCIYPLVPITIGIIGGQTKSKFKGFVLSIIYVFGISITYTVLGILASLGGRVFGLTANNPWVNLVVGIVLVIFGLSMFDIITLPFVGSYGLNQAKYRKNWIGIFVMGFLSGLIAVPCTTPILGSILTFVAINRSILTGGLLLFVYGFGCGTLLIIVGTFAGIASNLPKSGKWLGAIKNIFGIAIILSGLYFFYKFLALILNF